MFIGAYWNARQESLAQSAERLASALQSLATCDMRLANWFAKGRRKKAASAEAIEINSDALSSVLKTNNRDSDGTAIAELGFNLGLWNGDDSFPCSFNATCGGYSEFVKNSAVLQLPSDGNVLTSLSKDSLREILLGIVSAFDPDIAVLTSNEYLDQAGGGAPWEVGGWMVYRQADGIENLGVNEPVGIIGSPN
jgi:hypothetical protein